MSRFVELAKQAVRKMEPKSKRELDEYRDCVQAALRSICPNYPGGMVPWLEGTDPALYDELTYRLPQLISQQWNKGAPVEEFQRTVDDWQGLHRRVCDLYREYLSRTIAGSDFG
jgi:hypothetical protein